MTNYLTATQADPDNEQAFYYLGTAYEDIDQFDDAVAAYRRALALEPKYRDALHDLAIVYLAQGKVNEARELLPRLVATDRGWANEISRLIGRVKQAAPD